MTSSGWVLVDDADPRIQYSPGWQAFVNGSEVDGTKHGAAAAGLTASFNFTGTQVAVVGSLGSVDVHGVPTSLYTLDGAEAGLYTAPVIAPGLFQLNVTFFSSKSLSPGDHTLVITNVNGTSPNVFWLDYVEYVPSAAAASTTSSSSSQPPTTASSQSPTTTTSSTPTTSDRAGSSSTPHNHAGAIAGGIVGGVALVLAIAFLLVRLRRRRRGVANTSSDPCESPFIRTCRAQCPVSPSPSPSRADSARPPACLVHSTASVRPFGSWRSPDSAEAQTPNQTDSPASPPSQKQMVMTTMAGASTPTLAATLALPTGPTHTRTGLPPVSRAGSSGPTRRPSSGEPTRSSSGVAGRHSGSEPHVTQSVDSGLRLAGEAVTVTVLPPPYTRE